MRKARPKVACLDLIVARQSRAERAALDGHAGSHRLHHDFLGTQEVLLTTCSHGGSVLRYTHCASSIGIPLSPFGKSTKRPRIRSGFGLRSSRRRTRVAPRMFAEFSEPQIFSLATASCSTSRATRSGWSHRSSTRLCASFSFGSSARMRSTIGSTPGRRKS